MTDTLRWPWPSQRIGVAILAAVAYLPALLSSPGRMPADTKLYLYLDPGRLTRLAASTWDTSQFGGWVPHQVTTYLWPSGPWFWFFDTIGFPDWIAHRLWIGSLLFLGGWGVLRLARLLGFPVVASLVTALVYQVSTYILPYISRTSLMLLPWAALGWLTILTVHSVRRGGWRYPALFGLVIATVAQVNPTAFLMIVPGPIAWVAVEWAQRRLTARQVLVASGRLTLVSIFVSVWWVSMLLVQGRYGADVLGYSETIEAVSFTSTAPEVLRGLGYWLFYIRDPYAAATASSLVYQNSPLMILIGFALTATCLVGLVATRWRHRSYAVLLVLIGAVLSVGVHPFDDPSPVMGVINDSRLALALRSSTRALPLLTLGLGLGAGALASATRRWERGRWVTAGLLLLVAINMPSLWQAELVDHGLDRDQDPPRAWSDAADALDTGDVDARVLQIPGAEFGAFRWGYTVDPPLPFLTDKPVITRDLLPLGSAGVMDLLYAFDNRIQNGALDDRSVAPVARLLGADQLWITNDQAFDRFRTPRPEVFAAELSAPIIGLGAPTAYGDPVVNVPDIPMVDEQLVSDDRIGTPIPPVVLRPVEDAAGTVRLATDVVVVDGSGDGLVDAAAAGLIDGDEAIITWVDLTADRAGPLDAVLDGAARYIVTDSNRDRDEQWRGSQDATGMTETGGVGGETLRIEDSQKRLPRSRADEPSTQTIATLDGGLVVQASSYGELFAFLPEARAAMAVDGDPATSWRVGERGSPIGQSITISSVPDGQLHLTQVQDRAALFAITRVRVEGDGLLAEVELGADSMLPTGQPVDVPAGTPVTITILETAPRPGATLTGNLWVGFAELGPVAQEYVRPPIEALEQIRPDDELALVFSRERVRATNRWRNDPEPVMARRFELPADRTGELKVTLRLNGRAADAALDALLDGTTGPTSSGRLAGVPEARASAAFDGDDATAWMSPFHTAVGSRLTVPIDPTVPVTTLSIQQPLADRQPGEWATITAVRVSVGATVIEAPLSPDASGLATITIPESVGEQAVIEVLGVDGQTTIDRRYGDPTALPVAIAEIGGLPVVVDVVESPVCRDDLLSIDGEALGLVVDTVGLAAGEPVAAFACDGAPLTLRGGEHRLLSASGERTAIDVDLVSWNSPGASVDPAITVGSVPSVTVRSSSATSWTLDAAPCPTGCWLVFGQGHNEGWQANSSGAGDLGVPVPISGGFNGWHLPASDGPQTIQVDFAPQGTLRVGLLVSLLAVLACLAVVVIPSVRRRLGSRASQRATTDPVSQTPLPRAPEFDDWSATTARRAAVAGISLVVVTALFVDPRWSVVALVMGGALFVTRRIRGVAGLGIVGLIALAGLIARRQLRYGYQPGGGWPATFDDLHRPAMFVVLVVTVAAWATDHEDPEPENDHDGTDADEASTTDTVLTR